MAKIAFPLRRTTWVFAPKTITALALEGGSTPPERKYAP
jgi:hypothetical protein